MGRCRVGPTISSLITDDECGDGAAADELFSTLYSELHRMAKRELARRGSPANLSVTTLLHEAYLDIAEREGNCFPDRPRFMGYAARVMRGLIIDHARRSEEHTSELQSRPHLVCRLLLEKKTNAKSKRRKHDRAVA